MKKYRLSIEKETKIQESSRPLRCRGYYSEIITDEDAAPAFLDSIQGSVKKTNFLWQVKTEKHAPTVRKLQPPSRTLELRDAERWMTYDEDKTIEFSVETFTPKIQLQIQVYPRELTRKVATERLRRQFQAKDIRKLLDDLNITRADLVSVAILKKYFPKKVPKETITSNFLPLELFDDTEFDTRTPEDLIELGVIKGVSNPLPAVAFVPVPESRFDSIVDFQEIFNNLCEWINVAVTGYDSDTQMWKITTLDGTQRNFILPRIYVMFRAEDPAVFAQRIQTAVNGRKFTETKLKYKFCLNTMLHVAIPIIDSATLNRIFVLATRKNVIQDTQNWNKLVTEIQFCYKQTFCDLQFRVNYEKDPQLKGHMRISPKDWIWEPTRKFYKTGMKDYYGMRNFFRWMNIYVIPETYRAMSLVVTQCLKVETMSLYDNNYGSKHKTLDEFDSIQSKATNNVIKFLKGPWVETIVYNIRMCLGDIGKGWFDLNISNYEVYEVSKLSRFMELTKYRMQYSLRVLVLNSIEMFINLVEVPCLVCIYVEDDFVWGENLIDSPFISRAQAIFSLQLKMDENSAFYSTNPDLFEKTLLKLYDTALAKTHEVQEVHPYLLKNLKFSHLTLSSVGLLAQEIVDIRERFLLAYRKALIPLKAFAREFDIHLELFRLDIKDYILMFKEEQHTASEVKEEVAYHYRMKAKLEETLPASIIIGPFFIAIEVLRHFLIAKRQEICTKLLDMFAARMKNSIEEVLEEYRVILMKLAEKPDSIETIFDMRDWMETIPMLVRAQEELCRRYVMEYDVLDHFWYNLPQEDFENKWEAIALPYKIVKQVVATEEFLKEEEERFYKIQLNDEYTLSEKIDGLTVQVVNMSKQKDFNRTHEIAVDVRRLWKSMKEAQEQGQLLNQRQKLFGVPVIPFDNLLKLIKEFEPYKNLWITASDWLRNHEMWMDNPICNVDGEAIERNVTDMYKTILKSIRVFADIEAVQDVAIKIKDEIEEFKGLIPLLQSLRNPGMRERHWETFSEQTGLKIPWTPGITFKDFLDLGVDQYTENLVSIAEAATKEYTVEQTLEKMINEWETCVMDLQPYKDTGTYIMKIPDEIQQMLDDHLVLTQQINFSPFKGPFEQKIDQWEETLKITSDVIEEWMDVQKQWMYLEPILNSEDIRLQLPAESKKYSSMERSWRRIMRGARDNPYILGYCGDKKLLESLKDANHILEIVQKGLTDYLETKRIVFPRLYFLSDDELLEILSHAKNPLSVQPHLRKCFENIARLNFESDLCITQMFSAEEECVDLTPTLYPTANVEYWLLLVEGSMRNTVRTTLGDSLKQIYIKDRKDWVLQWPGQVVIAGSQTFWTAGVENGIRENCLPQFLEEAVLTNLDALRSLVKGSLSFLHREILSALIVIEVHSRDVTQTLVDASITNINDFDWISQLRYYWVEQGDLKVRAVNAEFQYGYEYLGNSGRLVITPLTDRCYLTLTGALHLKFGGAPAGPAGTGKTETTKDLAKAMALQCVVFNCSDQLDFMAMGKFFKGLASSGAWACFDEFNRIDIEVLSVVAQQITTIQKAQQARLDVFLFEGSEIGLKESCAVFITMNPGYAGRTELPDNLKALFRPVSMMVPNYSLISEISLFSFGFGNAKQLANKITTTFKLSSEQLSTQDHYDFGMRAVKTVIAVAGNLKREKPNMDERQIVLRALRDVNVPKFLKDDLKLFNGIVSDLFPKMVEEPVDYGALEESIRASCLKMGLEDVNEFVRKVIQLYETTVVRHGLMLVGPTASGKTKCYMALQDAMTALNGQPQPSGYPFRPVHTYVLNPKSITMGQLYGEFDLQTHEWTDGILPCLVRVGVSAEDKDKRWYVFDGPVDAVWIENMNTVLDDNKKLCLSSGEIIKLRDTMTMMFEVADLAVASPATVSRCGMVYLEPGVLGLEPFVNCWIKRLPADLIDSKLDRRRKGVFGPPVLKRQVFFIDDFNMPALEVYGAQPPIELIRQWMDFGGWYDRRNIGEFRTIIDVNFCAAMGPPGGGKNPVTARLLRHFHFLAFIEMEDDSKRKIFGTILKFWIDRIPDEFSLNLLYEPMLEATLNVYNTILKELLPTPAKTHYTFNLRDLSKVFQGILMYEPETLNGLDQMVRLWYHECCRIFQDRLVNDEDRTWFDSLLREKIVKYYQLDASRALGKQTLFFGDFLDPTTDLRVYVQITDMEKLSKVLDYYLNAYNEQTTRPMKLVLFDDAISHICRIARIIRQPLGNALLLGMGGSGRQSLTRLATFMAEFFSFQIEIHKSYGAFEWREDVKGLMLKAGLQRRETVFLFSDTQIKSESFLEDLNNILNAGDVPNIYQPEELDKIYQDLKGIVQELGLAATKSNLFAAYTKMVRSNLHTVITMSPIGDIFRARLRQFPALVNCCTIDWFSEWPDTALQSVALQFLNDISELDVTPDILNGIVMVCQYMHASVVEASALYKLELSRHNYVTPTSYLELLSSYTDLMMKKKGSLSEGIGRLTIGLDKMQSTAEEIKLLQQQLEDMKPALEEAAKDAEVMIVKIAEDQLVAEETKAVVEKEELEAAKMALDTQTIADDAQRDLDEALPALLEAEASLKSLNKNDITEVRSMKRPPAGVVYVIESICIVKGIKPNKLPGIKPGEKILDYWEPGRNMLVDPGVFLMSLMNFDKDSITDEMIDKLKLYVNNPSFQPAKVAKVSKACKSLCMWVHAMYKYYFVNLRVAPKKASLKKAKEELAETEAALATAKAKMQSVLDNLRLLTDQLAAKIAFREEKENSILVCEDRMDRAVRLINGLSDERIRWLNTISTIEENLISVTGDILLSAGAVAYLTPFTDSYRRQLLKQWLELIESYKIPCLPDTNPVSVLAEPVQIRAWQLDGLPRDYLSTENAALVTNSKRWPLFIDPQGQANKWVKNMGKTHGMSICKMADKDLLRTLESSIRFGKPVLIESVGTDLDPSLDPILLRQKFKQGGTWMLKLGEVVVPYDDDFRLYMTTKLPNPHYTPEVCVKVLLVNFTLVPSGLQDQLLALVVMQERPDLEEQRSQIIVGSTQMKQELKEIEDRILYKLSSLEGSPLDDLDFILTLEASKVKSDDIKNKVVAAEITQIDIDNTRAEYIPVANRAQILFFCLSDLSNVDPMYQYSLEWFVAIFIGSMAETEKTENIQERVIIINEYFTFSLYSNVCRSLFEKHKLHFAFLMCARILMDDKQIDQHEWHHFLAGGSPLSDNPNPGSDWLSAKAWKEIRAMESLEHYVQFVKTFEKHCNHYKGIFESPDPHRRPLPGQFQKHFSSFQKLLILKCLRPDKVTNAMQDFISDKMGQRFIEPQTTDLSVVFKDSGPTTPLIFVLSTGTDPAADLYKFADKMKFTKRMFSISLGQGQGPIAEKLLQNGTELGSWIFFQNCHLAPSWMPRLERIVENIAPEMVHRDFRIWLTSTPSPHFPVSILQNGSKMTVEPPSGIKANILRAYSNQVSDLVDVLHAEHPKTFTFKWLLFSLCLFHGVLLERRKFGPLGFNIPYEFTDGDLKICISQLKMFMWEYDEVPFKVLTYTAGHINYGGRVTDDWDRRCLMNVLADYYTEKVVNEKYVFDKPGCYHQLAGDTTYLDYLDYIKGFPINDDPELFGLHQNADITFAQSQTYKCLATLLMLQPKQVGGAAASQEEVIAHAAKTILDQLPKTFDLDKIVEKYPVLYEESLNTVLSQEAIRYNRLLKVIDGTLKDLLKAIKGLVVMSEALDKMSTSLYSNLVPDLWASKAYPSLKPLAAWVSDLEARVKFLVRWINHGIPAVFWISGFYFPQAFLTATLQNYARKYVVSIDTINFSFRVLSEKPELRPHDGCCIQGLFLEGARWNAKKFRLDESNPKELYTDMPIVWLVPEENHSKPEAVYECPVYKTLTRAGTLSTTGHSTNYVLAIEIPSKQTEAHWIKRAVALICALDY